VNRNVDDLVPLGVEVVVLDLGSSLRRGEKKCIRPRYLHTGSSHKATNHCVSSIEDSHIRITLASEASLYVPGRRLGLISGGNQSETSQGDSLDVDGFFDPDPKDSNGRNVGGASVQRASERERFPLGGEANSPGLAAHEREPVLLPLLRGEKVLERDANLSENGVLEEVPTNKHNN
jgi:hypothetical protein